ncbi:CBS domain-containing protein [Sinomicrobium soli]|uniref:CBS domain-containing protein n=1 Tax=Sinomicrobium sp. N-1-3-6 TaxID=2219864 RepID=UPI000DCCDCAB|nr:CBS domain-containing protein [Sinomicrobium sp. N-1-3-6]RAV30742.1 acetoin utilization protein acuB [Sinomicrobium sp. N-1-3-6]
MEINTCINHDVPPLSPDDTLEKARECFLELTNTHLPVVKDGHLVGNVSEEDMAGFDLEKKISDYGYALDAFFVGEHTHWLEVLEEFAGNNANIMPVLDKEGKYLGYYELTDIMGLFRETPFFNEPGGILIVEKGSTDYTFSEISQIVESNNGKLLGAFISSGQGDRAQITLKVGNTGLNAIIQSFRRYGYSIVMGNEDDMYLASLRERSDYLKKFLNI